jgi:hypothetical protein
MKFDQKIKELILEYFHVHFLGDKMYNIDFRVEKFRGRYNDFLNNARNIMVGIKSDRDKQKLREELNHAKERIVMALKYAFQEYRNEIEPFGKFFRDIGL